VHESSRERFTDHAGPDDSDVHGLRTPKTMIPAPISATLAPMTSQRSGRAPSTAQSQQMDDTM
jgi:hypothetical protein